MTVRIASATTSVTIIFWMMMFARRNAQLKTAILIIMFVETAQ